MSPIDYVRLIDEAIERLAELAVQKAAIEAEINKLRQFVYASLHMLPENVSRKTGERVKSVLMRHGIATASLTNAVRAVMKTSGWHTVANVRSLLQQNGFDFSEYRTNALASVATTLRRLKEADELESSRTEGLTAYRAKKRTRKSAAARPQ
jgi:hypothetical protein